MRRIKIERLVTKNGQPGFSLDIWRSAQGGWRASLFDWDGREVARFEVDEHIEKNGPMLRLHDGFNTNDVNELRPAEVKIHIDWSTDPPNHVNLEMSLTFGKTKI